MENEKEVLKSIPVYLPKGKMDKISAIAVKKRLPKTRLIELEIDKLIKRENNC